MRISDFSGALERIKIKLLFCTRLDKYFASSVMVDMYQEVFTKNRNTIRYLNGLNLHIKSGKENGYTVIGLFLDFEKAFDSVWKKALIVKLFDHGVNGVFLCVVNTFLFSRKVALKVNSFSGPSRKAEEYGLPQGSVLYPLLFKFYVSDLLSTLQLSNKSVNTLKFADDMTKWSYPIKRQKIVLKSLFS